MPQTEIRVFQRADGVAPLLMWLDELSSREPRAYQKCLQRILDLASLGYELRRPLADSLRDGVHELRIRVGTVQYRILYGFGGKNIALLSHALTKEKAIPAADIDAAALHLQLYKLDPDKHSVEFE